jgi:hypothetical protein
MLRHGKAEHLALFGQIVDPEGIAFLRPLDGNAQLLRQTCRTAGMIDVTVGQEDPLNRHVKGVDRLQNALGVAAWIHHRRSLGFVAPQD